MTYLLYSDQGVFFLLVDGFGLNNGKRKCMAQPVSKVIDGLSVLRGGVFCYRDQGNRIKF